MSKKSDEQDLHFTKQDEDSIDRLVDKELNKFKDDTAELKILTDIEEKPPQPGYMSVSLGESKEEDGLYTIDLNTLLAADLSNCPGTVIPVLLDNTVQTAFEIADAYKPEKIRLPFNWIWIIILIIGVLIVIFVILNVLPNMSINLPFLGLEGGG